MGSNSQHSDRLRHRINAERIRHSWSQAELAALFPAALGIYPSTIAKVEAGFRGVRTDELAALADIFGISVDALMGRASSGTDLVWAMSRLTSNAQKSAGEINTLVDRLNDGLEDVKEYATDSTSPDNLTHSAETALAELQSAHDALMKLASEFPLVGG